MHAPRWLESPWFWAAVAVVVRVAYLGLGPGFGVQPYSDSVDYHRLASHLANDQGFSLGPDGALYLSTFRPPLLPYVLMPFYVVFGPSYLVALLVQIVLAALTVPLAARLAAETTGRDSARLVAPLLALWPPLVYFATVLLTETLAALLTTAAILLAVRVFRRGGGPVAFGLGVTLGLAALARPTALPIAAALVAWLGLWSPGPFARRSATAALVVVGLAFAVVPWIVRNHAVTGEWIPITSGGGAALDDSNNPITLGDPAYRGRSLSLRRLAPYDSIFAGKNEVEIDRAAGERGRAFLLAHRDRWAEMVGWKLAKFFRVTSDAGGGRGPADPVFWTWGLLLPFFFVGLFAALARPGDARFALAVAILAQTALAVVYWGSLRMRAPVEPLIVILGAWILVAAGAQLKRRARPA